MCDIRNLSMFFFSFSFCKLTNMNNICYDVIVVKKTKTKQLLVCFALTHCLVVIAVVTSNIVI